MLTHGLVVAALGLLAPAAEAPKAEGPKAEAPKKEGPEVGKAAPDFTLPDQDGKDLKLSALKGKKAILLAFYPKDFTGG